MKTYICPQCGEECTGKWVHTTERQYSKYFGRFMDISVYVFASECCKAEMEYKEVQQ